MVVAGVEPDVVAFPSWGAVLENYSASSADVLLPWVVRYIDKPSGYQHWRSNEGFLHMVPKPLWSYSLVSAGRYSLPFMSYMRRHWEHGEAWYEEILLPTMCRLMGEQSRHRKQKDCSLVTFADHDEQSVPNHSTALQHFRYRPYWDCDEALQRAAALSRPLLWHPVKVRSCWLRYLIWLNCTARNRSQCGSLLGRPGPRTLPSFNDNVIVVAFLLVVCLAICTLFRLLRVVVLFVSRKYHSHGFTQGHHVLA